jgi:hypothetical protein
MGRNRVQETRCRRDRPQARIGFVSLWIELTVLNITKTERVGLASLHRRCFRLAVSQAIRSTKRRCTQRISRQQFESVLGCVAGVGVLRPRNLSSAR